MVAPRAGAPVLVLGLTPRTGTNYLWDLLRVHPALAPAREPIREDLFLAHSDLLVEFVDAVHTSWDPAWGAVDEATLADLSAAIGVGLLDFLTVDGGRRLVSKNPSVVGIDRVFRFFPDAQVLVLVRDGRAAVESCVRTFGWDFDLAARRWAAAAETALRFLDGRPQDDAAVRLVRYEDLFAEPAKQMAQLLEFLGLPLDDYDLPAAEALPVRGSSVFLGGRSRVHWEPVARTPAFDPLQRAAAWSPAQHERFAWLAGREQLALGYALDGVVPPTASARARQRVRSVRWRARRGADLAEHRLRGWLGPPTRPLRRRLGIARGS